MWKIKKLNINKYNNNNNNKKQMHKGQASGYPENGSRARGPQAKELRDTVTMYKMITVMYSSEIYQ